MLYLAERAKLPLGKTPGDERGSHERFKGLGSHVSKHKEHSTEETDSGRRNRADILGLKTQRRSQGAKGGREREPTRGRGVSGAAGGRLETTLREEERRPRAEISETPQ